MGSIFDGGDRRRGTSVMRIQPPPPVQAWTDLVGGGGRNPDTFIAGQGIGVWDLGRVLQSGTVPGNLGQMVTLVGRGLGDGMGYSRS